MVWLTPWMMVLCLVISLSTAAARDQFELVQEAEAVTVKLNGEVFTRYLIRSGSKPILWPIVGPSGCEMTRGYPMRSQGSDDERRDHPHHRSFWFSHGNVNGISFWHEENDHGSIVHREFVRVETEPVPTIVAVNDWIGPDGKKVCEDERILTFGASQHQRWIDIEVRLRASDGQLVLGDTKEGSFGIRVAGWLKQDADPGGAIVNSEGQTGKNAWGQPAKWVDYHGSRDGEVVGVAILNHPSSYGFPTHWHVRTYGLFAANPFGLSDFRASRNGKRNGTLVLEAGKSITLKYRVLFHRGDHKQAELDQVFKQYAKVSS